mmetsp:Transcript_58248/g.142406  ORF Transcript_58248/g.142406 Transcript_58248/m.142406 type:complete len:501 (-) Transcript_58248:44-1546(-)
MSQEKNGQEQVTETRSTSTSRSRPTVDHSNQEKDDQQQLMQFENLPPQQQESKKQKHSRHYHYYYYYLAVGVVFVAVFIATILSSRASSVAAKAASAAAPAASASTKQRFAVLSETARDTFGSIRLQRLFATMTSTAATTPAADTETSATSPLATMLRKKEVSTQYKLINKTQLSPDSYWLQYEIAKTQQAKSGEEGGSGGSVSSSSNSSNSNEYDILGYDPFIPTCIKVDYPHGTCPKTLQSPHTLSKSYSPVSHPSLKGRFDLIVKSYDDGEDGGGRPGGGVGKYICDMDVGQSITASLKSERIMHGSPHVLGRGWKHIGLVAGGTGIAPLLQIARIVLNDRGGDAGADSGDDAVSISASDQDEERIVDDDVQVYLLFINRNEHDILGRSEIDKMAEKYKGRFHVSYALTNYVNGDNSSSKYLVGRGDVGTAKATLPPPRPGKTMIFVCGKDGFVEHWAGPVGRAPPPPGKKKGPKIQGPLLGVLADAGYTADQVFKY